MLGAACRSERGSIRDTIAKRRKLGVSQSKFAASFGFGLASVQSWELVRTKRRYALSTPSMRPLKNRRWAKANAMMPGVTTIT